MIFMWHQWSRSCLQRWVGRSIAMEHLWLCLLAMCVWLQIRSVAGPRRSGESTWRTRLGNERNFQLPNGPKNKQLGRHGHIERHFFKCFSGLKQSLPLWAFALGMWWTSIDGWLWYWILWLSYSKHGLLQLFHLAVEQGKVIPYCH